MVIHNEVGVHGIWKAGLSDPSPAVNWLVHLRPIICTHFLCLRNKGIDFISLGSLQRITFQLLFISALTERVLNYEAI